MDVIDRAFVDRRDSLEKDGQRQSGHYTEEAHARPMASSRSCGQTGVTDGGRRRTLRPGPTTPVFVRWAGWQYLALGHSGGCCSWHAPP
jgi:hypothetical protein